MLQEWEKKYPGRVENMFTALQNVVPSHLMDRELHPFASLEATGEPDDDGRQGVRRRDPWRLWRPRPPRRNAL